MTHKRRRCPGRPPTAVHLSGQEHTPRVLDPHVLEQIRHLSGGTTSGQVVAKPRARSQRFCCAHLRLPWEGLCTTQDTAHWRARQRLQGRTSHRQRPRTDTSPFKSASSQRSHANTSPFNFDHEAAKESKMTLLMCPVFVHCPVLQAFHVPALDVAALSSQQTLPCGNPSPKKLYIERAHHRHTPGHSQVSLLPERLEKKRFRPVQAPCSVSSHCAEVF